MAIIGTFNKDGKGYDGNIEMLTLKAKITLRAGRKKKRQRPGVDATRPKSEGTTLNMNHTCATPWSRGSAGR